jgi:hypothetical protein
MDNMEVFTLIGKLYYDLIRSQNIIDSLKKQLELYQQIAEQPNASSIE